MSPIIVSKWHNPDVPTKGNYVCSYILRQQKQELFRVDLNMEQGFFELSEFVSSDEQHNFMIEQISRVGKVKINIFDKHTGNPIAMLCNNLFKDEDEQKLFELKYLKELNDSLLCYIEGDLAEDDYAGVTPNNGIGALFVNLPKAHMQQKGLFSKVSKWAKNRGDAPKDVLEIQLTEHNPKYLRAICALGVIVNARRGIQLPTTWQDAVRKSG